MDSLFKSEDRYKTIVELAPDVVYTISKLGLLTSLSSAFEKITGWKREEWIGKNFAGIVHPFDLPHALYNFRRALKGEDVPYYKLRILTKKGDYLIGEFKSASDIVNGKVIGVIGIGRDITQAQKEQGELDHYRNIVRSADSAIISRELDGKILTWNHAAEELFGYSKAEAIGRNFSMIVPQDKRKELERINRMVKRGQYITDYETVRVKKNGERIYIMARISPIRNEDGKVIGVSLFDRDNTEARRELEQEKFLASASKVLSSSLNYNFTLKKLARLIAGRIADRCAIYILEDSDRIVRSAVYYSDKGKEVWSISKSKKENDGPSSRTTLQTIRTGESKLFQDLSPEIIKKTVRDKEIKDFLLKVGLVSSMNVPLVSGRKVLGAISFLSVDSHRRYNRDDLKFAEELGRRAGQAVDNAKLFYEAQKEISKRRKIEAQLRQSRDELNVILQNVADGITVQGPDGKLIYANDAAALSSGYNSVREMLKSPSRWVKQFNLLDENGNEFPFERLPGRRAMYGEIDPKATINYVNKKTGESSWSVVKARPVFDELGRVKAVVNIVNDITQRMELERRKDDFISIASHELKTPVTSIKGFLHLIKKRSEGRSLEYLEKVDVQLGKLTELIEDLLSLSNMQTGKISYRIESFEISKLIKEVVSDLQASSKHKIIFKNGARRRIKGDKDRISQVLNNLISNAIKYSPKGDKVYVHLKDLGSSIEVSVKDKGIGMDKDENSKIFDRFYRVKDVKDKTFPGLGIGLYLSKEIVSRHKGRIWVESKKGKGSTFHFKIPTVNV